MPLKSIFPSIPIETQPFGDRLLNAFWNFSSSTKNPNKKALISAENPNNFVTYKDLYLHSLSVTAFLETREFGHGDIASLVLNNSLEFLEIVTGVALIGGGISGASVLFNDYELERQLIDSKTKIIFCGDNFLNRVLKASKNCKTLKTIVVVVQQIYDQNQPYLEELPFGVIPFSDVISTQPNFTNSKIINIDVERDIFLLPYSSGTTGSPKGVMLSHQNYSTMMSIFLSHYQKYIYPNIISPKWDDDKEISLLSMPFYHVYGFAILIRVSRNCKKFRFRGRRNSKNMRNSAKAECGSGIL